MCNYVVGNYVILNLLKMQIIVPLESAVHCGYIIKECSLLYNNCSTTENSSKAEHENEKVSLDSSVSTVSKFTCTCSYSSAYMFHRYYRISPCLEPFLR